jgi:hypothetical protein
MVEQLGHQTCHPHRADKDNSQRITGIFEFNVSPGFSLAKRSIFI